MTRSATEGDSVPHRFVARVPGPALWVALWTAAIAAEALALRPVLFPAEGPFEWLNVVFTLIGGSFAAFGLVAWRRRPDSNSGMLMTATGFGFFVGPLLGQLDFPLAHTARVLLVDWWIFFFATLILTLLTSGRLQSRFDRLLVASFAVPLVILQIAWMLVDPEEGYLLLAFPDADVAHVIDRVQRGLLACSCIATVVVIASEALANVAKYSRATHATVRVWRAGATTSIEIADDGVGGADDSLGSGLRGLADRVEALDGTLRVSSPPGAGTTVTAELPCAS